MTSYVWNDRAIRALYQRHETAKSKLRLYRERQANGLNPINGVADDELVWMQEISADFTRLDFTLARVTFEAAWEALPDVLTALYALYKRLTARDTVAPALVEPVRCLRADVASAIDRALDLQAAVKDVVDS